MKRYRDIIWPLLIMGAAFCLRFYPDNSGLDICALYRHDELNYVPRVIAFLNGDWHVDYFVNPSLYMYVLYAATSVTGWCSVLFGQFSSFEDFSLHVTFNPHIVVLLGRILSIVISTLSVGLVYLLAKRMFSVRVAVTAAAALALNVAHARRAVLVGNETLMVFLVLLFFLGLLSYLRSPDTRKHLLCGMLLGLAGSVKYNAFIHVVPFAVATLLAWRKERVRLFQPRFFAGFLVMAGAFLLGSPCIVTNLEKFLYDFTHQYAYLHEGFTSFDRLSLKIGFLYYLENFPIQNNGIAYGIVCGLGVLAGLAYAVKRRDERLILLLCAVLPLYLFLGVGSFSRMRFFLPAIPFALILGAWFLSIVVGNSAVRCAVYYVLSAALLLPAAIQVHTSLAEQYGVADPRSAVVQWIMEHHDQEAKTLEYTHTNYSDFPYSTKVLKVFGYEDDWFTTEKGVKAWQRFHSGLHDFTPFPQLLKRAQTLEELKRLIAEEGYRYLLVTMPAGYITSIDRFPERGPHLTGGFPQWDELLRYMATLPLTKKIVSSESSLTMLLYEL